MMNHLFSLKNFLAVAFLMGVAFQSQSASAQAIGQIDMAPGYNQPGYPGHHGPGYPGHHGRPDRPGRPGRPDYPGQPGYPGYPQDPGYPNYPGQPGYPGNGGYGQIDYREAEQITQDFYRAFLFRNPDPQGLQNSINMLMTRGEQGMRDGAAAMMQSREFYQNIRSRYSDQQILANIYRVFFHRQVDPSGAYNWGQLMRQGRYGEVASGIVGSDEFRRNYLY